MFGDEGRREREEEVARWGRRDAVGPRRPPTGEERGRPLPGVLRRRRLPLRLAMADEPSGARLAAPRKESGRRSLDLNLNFMVRGQGPATRPFASEEPDAQQGADYARPKWPGYPGGAPRRTTQVPSNLNPSRNQFRSWTAPYQPQAGPSQADLYERSVQVLVVSTMGAHLAAQRASRWGIPHRR